MQPLKSKIVRKPPMDVDIIIPFHGAYEKVYACCKNLWYSIKEQSYRIYLVDDCSPNETYLGAFAEAPHVVCVRTKKHLGFGGALMEGFKAAYEIKQPSQWVIFMHSDCEVRSHTWLPSMFASYERLFTERVAMVSARSNNPGVDALMATQNKKDDDFVLKEGYLPLFCSLCRRELIEGIGGIKPYPIAMYEDEEFAFRMKVNGFKQGVSGNAWVYHHGGATIDFVCKQQLAKNYKGPDYRQIMESNRFLCVQDMREMQMMLEQQSKQKRISLLRK